MNNQPMHALASLITEKFIVASPQEAAQALACLATHEVILLIGGLKAHTLVRVLNLMVPAKAAAVLRRLPLKQSSYVLTHLDIPQASKLWKEFATPYQARLKEVLPTAFVELLLQASGFEADQVGHLMNTDFVTFPTDTKVSELIARLKNIPRRKLPEICFITGHNGDLKGIIPTSELVFFNPSAVCGSIMVKTSVLHPQDTFLTAQEMFTKEEFPVLPVVNEQGILIGKIDKITVFTTTPTKKTLWEKIKG